MPKAAVDAASLLIALFIVLLLATGILTWLWEGFRAFLLERIIGSVVRNALGPVREEERRRQQEDARAERIRRAIDDLSSGLATGSVMNISVTTMRESADKVQRAVSILRIEAPELKVHLDRAGAGARLQTQQAVRHILDPIIEGVRPMLTEPYAQELKESRSSQS